jgi:hypothetical protein
MIDRVDDERSKPQQRPLPQVDKEIEKFVLRCENRPGAPREHVKQSEYALGVIEQLTRDIIDTAREDTRET